MDRLRDDDENFCREQLGLSHARGSVAARIRELSPASPEELLARPLRRGRFLVVDLETTGMRADKSRIIEVGAVEVDGVELGRELGSLVYPEVPVPAFITSLTGISTSMLLNQPRIEEVLPVLERMLRGRVLVCHNLSFDITFLKSAWEQQWGKPLDAPNLCTVKLGRRVFPECPAHNLDAIVAYFKFRATVTGAKARHRALGDAQLTALALVKMIERAEEEGMAATVGDLLALQSARRKRRKKIPSPLAPPESG